MNLQSILYAFYLLTRLKKIFAGSNPELVISRSGVDTVAPCAIGLKFFIELNNRSDRNDYEVQISADQCCLEGNGSLDCDVLDILGDCVGIIPRGAIKTVRMVAPILDPIERRGYCILYLDSKCNDNGMNMRDTVKIHFNTTIGNINEMLEANIRPCKCVDEDPFNDCNPVDCDPYYNNRKPFYSRKYKRCVTAPVCVSDSISELPNAVYDPVSNRCVRGKSINKRDVDYIKALNSKARPTKDLLIINNYDYSNDDHFTNSVLSDAFDKVPTCKKCNKLHILDPQAMSLATPCHMHAFMGYIRRNKYTLSAFGAVILLQCCLIAGLLHRFSKGCLCCRKKLIVSKFFNYRQDASVTTPLIGTSNMDTETDCQFETESSNVDNRLKCYKACQKERSNNANMSMSDDILSKCVNRRNWSRQQNKTEAIPEGVNEAHKNMDKSELYDRIRTEIDPKNVSQTRVVFEDEKPKIVERFNKKIGSIPQCLNKEIIEREKEEIELQQSSEIEIQCHSYNDCPESNATGFKPNSIVKDIGYFQAGKRGTPSASTDKEVQAYFSNDSIDDLLSERGIYHADDISKLTVNSSTPTPVSNKTSKNNLVKNLIALLHRKSKTNASSDPGAKSKENLDVKLIHMSRVSICSTSNDSECLQCAKTMGSRTSL